MVRPSERAADELLADAAVGRVEAIAELVERAEEAPEIVTPVVVPIVRFTDETARGLARRIGEELRFRVLEPSAACAAERRRPHARWFTVASCDPVDGVLIDDAGLEKRLLECGHVSSPPACPE